jgi:type IV pilus assembly protein PilA
MAMIRRTRALVGSAALVVGVVAWLCALGFPSWETYRTRHRVADAIDSVASTKLAVLEDATIKRDVSKVSASDFQYREAMPASDYVSRVHVADGGVITLTTRNTGAVPDPVIVLIPTDAHGTNGDLQWDCQVFIGDRSLAPAACQGRPPGADNSARSTTGSAAITVR